MIQSPTKRRRGRPAIGTAQEVSDEGCLTSALEHFAVHGFEGASVREIARQAGVSHGLLTAKYGSKEGLWRQAVSFGMEKLFEHMSAPVPQGPSDSDDILLQMRNACIEFLMGVARYPAIFRIMNTEGATPSPRLDYLVQTFFHDRAWPIVVLLKAGQQQGLLRSVPPIVPFTLLAHGGGALVGLAPLMQAIDTRLGESTAALTTAVEAAVDIIVQGLLVLPSPDV